MAQANATRIGAFVLGGIGLLVAVVLGFGSGALFSPSAKRAIVVQESLQGLQVGAPVTYNGVVVGEVVAIGAQLLVDEARIVNGFRVRLISGSIAADRTDVHVGEVVDHLVERGLRAQLAIQSVVTAALYVRLVMAPEIEPYEAPDKFLGAPTMPAIPSDMARFGQLAETIGADLPRMLEQVETLAASLTEVINEENRTNLTTALAGLAGFATSLNAIGPDLVAAAADIRTATARLPAATERAEVLIGNIDDAVADKRTQISAVLDAARDAAETAAGAAGQIDAMVRENRSGVRTFTQEGLAEVRTLAMQAQSMVRAIDRVARRIETEGIGTLIGGEALPEYRPRTTR